MGLAFVAAVAVLFLLFFTNPELLDKVWLWMVGLAGYILILLEKGLKSVAGLFEGKNTQPPQPFGPASRSSYEDLQSKIDKMEGRILQIESRIMSDKDL